MKVFRVTDPALQGIFFERMFVWKRQDGLAALDWGGFQSRNAAMARLIELADDTYGLAEFGPLTISTSDQPVNVDPGCICLGFSETDGYEDIAIPDFVFDGWPETGIADYAETTWEMADAGASAPEQARCGWIGDPNMHEHRYHLIEISQARPDLLDASGIDWVTGDRIRSPIDRDGTMPFNYRSLPQQASRWSSLIDIEGRGYSARLKILLHSGRPVFIQERPWREWYWAELVPMQNFIPVKRDLSDLVEKLEWAHDNAEEAAAIGRAGQAFALAKLTREAALLELAQTLERVGREHSEASYVPEDLRAPLDPVLTSLGAFA
jgi:Glycosyl transferase family 90